MRARSSGSGRRGRRRSAPPRRSATAAGRRAPGPRRPSRRSARCASGRGRGCAGRARRGRPPRAGRGWRPGSSPGRRAGRRWAGRCRPRGSGRPSARRRPDRRARRSRPSRPSRPPPGRDGDPPRSQVDPFGSERAADVGPNGTARCTAARLRLAPDGDVEGPDGRQQAGVADGVHLNGRAVAVEAEPGQPAGACCASARPALDEGRLCSGGIVRRLHGDRRRSAVVSCAQPAERVAGAS